MPAHRHFPRLQTEANRDLQPPPAHQQTRIFSSSRHPSPQSLHPRTTTRTRAHAHSLKLVGIISPAPWAPHNHFEASRLSTSISKTTILQSTDKIASQSHHLLTMAITSRLPNGERVINSDEQFPNCIIASSNRYADLRPYCDSIYDTDKTKWGSILPWEFPQNATREVEEAFLRRFFTEVEIHMQGGAHGVGAGFRFLKQAWYSIALRNLYHGIPALADKWMDENVALLEDPTMRGHLCEPAVTPETFFRSQEIQQHTRKLLKFVVPVIQAKAKIKYEQPAESTSSSDSQRPTTDVTPVSEGGEAEVRPTSLVMPASVAYPAAATDRSIPITSAAVPAGPYAVPASTYQGTKHRQSRDFTPGYSQHHQQIHGRKRDSQNSSNSFGRPFGNGRRQSDNYHQFNPNVHPAQGGFSSGTPSFVAAIPGTMSSASSSTAFPPHGAPPGQSYHAQGLQTSQHQVLGPYPPSNGSVSQDMFNSAAFHNTPRQRFPQPRHISNHSDNERFSNTRTRDTSFNDVSTTSGDARRTSFGSRGGALRGQYRASRGRGGRTSFGMSSEERPQINQVSGDFYSNSGQSHVKRHSSAYQGNSWRSSSEHPQVENAQPHRVFSGPDQYPPFQDFHGPTGTRLLPPFIFPHGPEVTHQGPPALHRPLQTGMTHNPPTLGDFEVGRNYIGADAHHANQLVVSNIPVEASEADVAKTFAHACDVEVTRVKFPAYQANIPLGVADKAATVSFANHQVARRVLDLREVSLYGRPLRVRVPNHHIRDGHPDLGDQSIFAHRNQAPYGPPPQNFNPWNSSVQPPQDVKLWSSSVQPPLHNVPVRPSGSFMQSNESGYASYPPSTPFHSVKGEQALSVVQSVNATPENSGPNTPKKSQGKSMKKKNKHKNKTNLVSTVEGESAIALDKTTALETPVKPPKQKRQAQSSSVSTDLPLAPRQVSPLTSSSAAKDSSGSEPIQSLEKSIENDDDATAAAASSHPLNEASLEAQSPELEKDCSHKGPAASKDALATEPTQVSTPPSKAEPTSSSKGSPTAEPTGDHPQVYQSEVGSDTTPKVSPRSQLPVQQSSESSPNPVQESVSIWSENQSLPPQSSPLSTRSIRPASVDRRLSDSDHVDESFHTASASPPEDKQTQAKEVTAHSQRPTHLIRLTSAKSRPDTPVSPVSSQTGRSVAVVTPKTSPKTEMLASIQNPTPSKSKTSLVIGSKDDKSQTSMPQPGVINALDVPKVGSAIQKSDDCRDEIPSPTPDTVVQRVLPAIPSLGQAPTRSDIPNSQPEEKVADTTKQGVKSSSSVPPTPTAADRDARKAPAPTQSSTPAQSQESSSSKSKAAAKKGPPQTESLSMFGKKQKKQKKSAKGKGTLKGKPQDSGSVSGLSDCVSSRDLSGFATPPMTAIESTTAKKAASLNVNTRLDNRANADSNSDESKSVVSRQESPGKGGLLGRVGNFFSMTSSPSVSGHETMPQDAMPNGTLTYSKAPVAVAPISSNIEDDPVDNPSTTSDLGGKHEYGKSSDTYDHTMGTSGIRGAEAKKRKRSKKQKKQNVEQKGDSVSVATEGGGEEELVSSNSVAGALEDTRSESRDPDYDNRSDDSSTTMGHPTPQASPKRLSEGKRKQVENRVANSEQHILTPPAPRNQHFKRKSYSRSSASSATGLSKQEATPPTTTTTTTTTQAMTETEVEQQSAMLQLFRWTTSEEDEEGSHQMRPRVLVMSRSGEAVGNGPGQLTLTDDRGGFKFIHFNQGGDDASDQAVLQEHLGVLGSAEAPSGRILEEVMDSEDESNK